MSLVAVGVNHTIHLFFSRIHPILLCLLPWCFLSVLCSFCMNLLFQVSQGKVQVQILMQNLTVWPDWMGKCAFLAVKIHRCALDEVQVRCENRFSAKDSFWVNHTIHLKWLKSLQNFHRVLHRCQGCSTQIFVRVGTLLGESHDSHFCALN